MVKTCLRSRSHLPVHNGVSVPVLTSCTLTRSLPVSLRAINPCPADFPLSRASELPAEEQVWLEQLEARLIVPITGGRQKLIGVLLLGEKRSEEPYTGTDRNLVEAIAAQMGVVYDR